MPSDEITGLRLVRVRNRDGLPRVGVVAGDDLEVLDTDDVVAILQADERPSAVERVAINQSRDVRAG
jgi:hypothetical protein